MQVPESLLVAMRSAECIRVDTPRALRIALLKDEYAHFIDNPASLHERLQPLVPLLGRKVIERWQAAGTAGDFDTLVGELLDSHYDPIYGRSIERNFPRSVQARRVVPEDISVPAFSALARAIVAQAGVPVVVTE